MCHTNPAAFFFGVTLVDARPRAPTSHYGCSMTAILLRQDGTHQSLRLDAANITSCVQAYEQHAVSCVDVDQVDIRAVEQRSGSIEFTACIYDTGAGNLMRDGTCFANKHFQTLGCCVGDVLVFKTLAPATCFEDVMMDSVFPVLDMDVAQCIAVIEEFSSKLNSFTKAVRCHMYPHSNSLFPFLMKHTVDGKHHYYECHGSCSIVDGSVEVDLLTFKTKRRRLTAFGTSFAGMFADVFAKSNVKRFCIACKNPTRFCCSRCKAYYWCGAEACKQKAWETHKPHCSKK